MKRSIFFPVHYSWNNYWATGATKIVKVSVVDTSVFVEGCEHTLKKTYNYRATAEVLLASFVKRGLPDRESDLVTRFGFLKEVG